MPWAKSRDGRVSKMPVKPTRCDEAVMSECLGLDDEGARSSSRHCPANCCHCS